MDTADDSRDQLRLIARSFAESCPELMRELGCGVLADRAVPAWEHHALCVFRR